MEDSNGSKKEAQHIQLNKDLLEKLEKSYDRYKHRTRIPLKLHTYANLLIREALEKEEFLTKIFSNLRLFGVSEDTMSIEDMRKNKVYRVQRAGKTGDKLKCIEDDNYECEHITYALATREIPKIFKNPDTDEIHFDSKWKNTNLLWPIITSAPLMSLLFIDAVHHLMATHAHLVGVHV